jgi:CO/xanthine dehydrogenase FAD-binding subunit
MGRYQFSDVLTALLALNAHLEFYKHGHISLEAYLENPFEERDILTKIVVPQAKTSLFNSTQATYTDFSTVNLAVVKNGDVRIAIGARPMVSTVISHADLSLSAAELLANIDFGSDFKASADYRRTLAETMLSDALKEVRQWK